VQTRTSRRFNAVIAAGGALLLGGAAAIGAAAGDNERVTRYWTRAEIGTNGGAAVTDSIDYAFGPVSDHHGIDRFVPGLALDAHVEAKSDAPAPVQLIPETHETGAGTKIRIGDPATTVSGHHRYRIDYPLATLVQGDTVDWEALGTESNVSVGDVEVHLLTPYELMNVRCTKGGFGSTTPCDAVKVVEPGHVMATVSGLDAHEGVSLEGLKGKPVTVQPAVPQPPIGAPDDPGTGLVPPLAAGVAGGLVGALLATVVVRRAGRERVAPGGAADVAYAASPAGGPAAPVDAGAAAFGPGPVGSPVAEIRVDADELAAMATTEFAPPSGVSPAHGGIVLDEEVLPRHKVAWLIQAAIDGAIDLDDEDGTVVVTRKGAGDEEQAAVFGRAFDHRDQFSLGHYDREFANAWSVLGYRLKDWRATSGLWDRRGDTRKVLARIAGVILFVLGGLAVAAMGAMAGRQGSSWLPLVGLAALVAGAGLAACIGAWELRIRTAAGSGLWLRVESFRRFLAGSEAFHAEEAAKRGVLREYTAWAVAVGEIDRWQRAVAASSVIPEEAGISYAYLAPSLLYSTSVAATAPSSSSRGGGGFGGGSVGGGGGGGGVGSW
jgi:hypothetical protein